MRRSRMRRYLCIAASWVVVAGVGALSVEAVAAEEAHAAAAERVFVGYVFRRIEGLDFKLYTHLCHAFVTADETGKLKPNNRVPSRELTTAAHQAGVRVLLSLGGWGWDEQFAAMMRDHEAEERYVAAVLEMVDQFDYDGVDLDWEYPDTEEEVVNFERLARRFRRDLDALGATKERAMLLTMAASASPSTLRWLRSEFLLETMDWVNVMTYDYAGVFTNFAGHHAPLFDSSKQPADGKASIERTMQYLLEERKLPANRLALGLPLYGKGFAVAEPYASTIDAPKRRAAGGDYRRLADLIEKQGWRRTWDDETKTPWLHSPDGDQVIGYDDAESLVLKTAWANEHGLRGVFFWEVGADRQPDGRHPLQEAVRAKWDAR
jgi:chitinase